MSCEIRRYHDEEKSPRCRKDWKKVRFEANEGANGEEGDGLRGLSPGEETLKAVLEDKYNSDSGYHSACDVP